MRADCHIHMVLDGVYWKAAIAHQKERVDEALVRQRLEEYRRCGAEYLRDGGDAWGVGLFASQIAQEYGIRYRTPAFPIHKNGHYGGFIGRGFDDMVQYRALVAEARAQGAHFIKIMISGLMDFDHLGVLTDEPLTEAEIHDMIAIAHDAGFAVMAHANGDKTVAAAIRASVDSVEHGAYLEKETLHLLAERGTVWVPTLVTDGSRTRYSVRCSAERWKTCGWQRPLVQGSRREAMRARTGCCTDRECWTSMRSCGRPSARTQMPFWSEVFARSGRNSEKAAAHHARPLPVSAQRGETRRIGSRNAPKQKKRQARRLVFLFVLSDRTLNLVGTQASCTDVYMARSTVNNRFYPFDVGLPCSVGSSMRMGNFNSKSNALAADIALCHQLHLLAD